ncbi:5'-methylthioadenosine/S-adenosylhomocysteine nucleosidase [Paenibacillus apii]|uniref:5'-methylthioadenosine/S-adenosylhomocysteine nucleosidase n=1 Tax=Paenibacillus apii TaxID=1850370 RepID=UPI00143C5397|nr:5'-methylthioadenosine/S-adenosylhomocysteine nucleosidase [Paenibacillus apii]NJJ41987.1 5'-methylthioadenosine/S-adenosylhomocysteine nucleosidase [Paenibacillus apii]
MANGNAEVTPLRIGVLSALVSEIEPLLGWVGQVRRIPAPVGLLYQASYGGHELFLGVAGTQKTNTAAALQALITGYRPDVLFFTGVAGALDPELAINDVVLASSVVHHDAGVLYGSPQVFHPFGPRIADEAAEQAALWGRVNRFNSDRGLLRAARQAAINLTSLAPDRKFKEGVIATGDQVVFSSEKRQHIQEQFEALAVETEGAAFAQVAWTNKVPFLVVRSVSDDAHEQSLSAEKLARIVSATPIHSSGEETDHELARTIHTVAESAAALVLATIDELPDHLPLTDLTDSADSEAV